MVVLLLVLNGVVFLAEGSMGNVLIELFALWPLGMAGDGGLAPQFHVWQLVSYAFLHGGWLHIALNMYALWLFGAPLEQRWGSGPFLAFYLSCVIGAALTHLVVAEFMLMRGYPAYPVIGASGGVFGLLLAFGYLYPRVQLMLLIPPIPIEARWFVIGYGAIELFAGVTGTESGVAHFAHLGGMLTGYLLLRGTRRFR